MAVPVYERKESISPLPGARVEAPGGAGAYGGGVGSAVTKLADAGMKLLEDFEDAQTLEAFNNFKRDVSLYHNSPEKGVLNRQGKDARGLFQDADLWMQNRAEEYAKKMRSPRMVNNFRRMAGQTIVSQGDSNSRYEGVQLRNYRVAEAEAAIDMAIDEAAVNWQDDEAVEAARQDAIAGLVVELKGAGEEVWKARLAKLNSDMGMARLGRMIEADPVRAEQWYKENKKDFLGADQAKADDLLEKATRSYKTQSAVDSLVKQFPPAREREALKYIREKYSGDEEEQIATAYKARVNELEVKKGSAEAAVRKAQNSNFEMLKTNFYRNGKIPSQEELDSLLDNNYIRADQYQRAMSWNDNFATRAKTIAYLQKNDPNWDSYTPVQRETRVMRTMGKTSEQHKAVLNTIRSGVLDGSVTDADIDNYLRYSDITENEANHYKNLDKKIDKEQKAFNKKQKEALKLDVAKSKFSTNQTNVRMFQAIATQSFDDKLDDLDPTSKTYRQDVLNARREAFVEAVEATGRAEMSDAWIMKPRYTDFGRRVHETKTAIDIERDNVREYVPEDYESQVDLPSEEQPSGEQPQQPAQPRPPFRVQPAVTPVSPFIPAPQPAAAPLPGPRIETEDRKIDSILDRK